MVFVSIDKSWVCVGQVAAVEPNRVTAGWSVVHLAGSSTLNVKAEPDEVIELLRKAAGGAMTLWSEPKEDLR